jgi:hypothetical protein
MSALIRLLIRLCRISRESNFSCRRQDVVRFHIEVIPFPLRRCGVSVTRPLAGSSTIGPHAVLTQASCRVIGWIAREAVLQP